MAQEEPARRGPGRPRKWQSDAQRMACARIGQREHAHNTRQVHLLIARLAQRGESVSLSAQESAGVNEEDTFRKLAAALRAL